jgi:hypothetical protein
MLVLITFVFKVGSYSSDALLPIQPPNELLNFIEKQESYIEQLERESNFCRVSLEKIKPSRMEGVKGVCDPVMIIIRLSKL